MNEKYQPTPEEIIKAEDSMTEEQRRMTEIREEGFALGVKEVLNGKEKKVEKIFNPEILKETIDIVDLGKFTGNFKNACKKMNVTTIQELISHYDNDFLKNRNFGRKTLFALQKWLADRGLKLKEFIRKSPNEYIIE